MSCRVLDIDDYADEIHLFDPYKRFDEDYKDDQEMENHIKRLVELISHYRGFSNRKRKNFSNFEEVYVYVRTFLNVREPVPLDPELNQLIDEFLAHIRLSKEITPVSSINPVSVSYNNHSLRNPGKIALWKGDITLLQVDAIVNAANSQMLGCFAPMHICIDNCIHTFAGPQLRDDCFKIMSKQKIEEPNGYAKITRAYNLPSSFVIHTVGPIYQEECAAQCEQELKSCYNSILDCASLIQSIRSVAFCCISTGVFRYPAEEAAKLAIKTVDDWISSHPDKINLVVFNVFSQKDLNIYENLLAQ